MSIFSSDLKVITCCKCNSRVNQFSNKRRTICPYCGNLFEINKSKNHKNVKIVTESSISSINITSDDMDQFKTELRPVRSKIKSPETLIAKLHIPLISLKKSQLYLNENCCRLDENLVEKLKKETDSDSLKSLVINKQEQKDWEGICDVFCHLFSKLKNIYFHFHIKNSSEIQLDKLDSFYVYVSELPEEFQKVFMETIENTIKSFDILNYIHEEILALIIILLNSLFDKEEYFSIFELCLSSILSIKNRNYQQTIIGILIRLPIEHFKILLRRVQNFLSFCLFTKKLKNCNKEKIVGCWIKNAVQFIVLLNATNEFIPNSRKLPRTAFYNCSIDHENLIKDYNIWQNRHLNDFTFCQYPCVLTILAKKQIIQKESEEQMIIMAKNNLLSKVQQHQIPEFDMIFLNLYIRRSYLVFDSINEILEKRNEIKKKIKVKFIGEPGVDMGGLTKEWFLLLLREILHAKNSVFTYDAKSRYNWFHSVPSIKEHTGFYLTGILMGLAVYNSINLDVKFPLLCYKKLLSPKLYMPRNKQTGFCLVTIEDLNYIHPDLGRGLNELLLYEGNVENDICVTFEIIYEDCYGNKNKYSLIEDGSNIYVTSDNRKKYVDLYCNFLLNSLIEKEFYEFYRGFHTVCDSNAFLLLQPEEIENLVCGNAVIDLKDLKIVVEYDNYRATDKTIILFWDVLLNFSENQQKLFLHFTTGSDRIPVGGIQELQFKISKTDNSKMLPMAYTCFNQLILPTYTDRNELQSKLLLAMENSEGFGLK